MGIFLTTFFGFFFSLTNYLNQRTHSLDAILLLLVFAYSLAGDDSENFDLDERSLKNLLVQAIMSEQEPSELILSFGESKMFQDNVSSNKVMIPIIIL